MAAVSDSGGGSGPIRAGRAFVELFADDNKIYRSLERLKARFQSFAGFAAKAGTALGAAGAAVAAGFKPALDALGDQAQIGNAADAFGITAEKASRLFGVFAAAGSDVRDATEGVVTFNQRVSDALAGSGEEAKKFFQDLGQGPGAFQALDSSDRIYALLDALRQVPDPAKRVQLLLKAVGEDTGKNLIPLLSMSAAQVRELGDAFESSTGDINSAREAARAQTLAGAMLGKVWREVATSIAPTVKELSEGVRRNLGPVIELVRNNRELVATVGAGAVAATAAGAALVVLGFSINGVVMAYRALTFTAGLAYAAVSSPLLLGAAVGAGAVAAVLAATGHLEGFFGFVRTGFLNVAGVATEAWGGIAAALSRGDLASAGAIAMKGLEVAWRDTMNTLEIAWAGFKFMFGDAWSKVVLGAKLTLNDFASGAEKAFLSVAAVIANAFRSVTVAILEAAIRVGEVIDRIDPTDTIKGAIARATALRDVVAGLGKLDAGPARAEVEAERAKREKELVDAEVLAEKARKKGLVDEVAAADARLAKAKAELADLVAKAKAIDVLGLVAGAGAGIAGLNFGPAVSAAATISGSKGSFSAANAAQRLGSDRVQVQQLKVAQEGVSVMKQVRDGVEGVARGLAFK